MSTRLKLFTSLAVIAAMLVVPTTISSAQDSGVPTCSGAEQVIAFPNVGFNAGAAATIVAGNSGYDRSKTVSAAIPAGEYAVIAASLDWYTGRSGTALQAFEQYVLEFIDADGDIIATTGLTADLEDFVEQASWTGSVGTVVLDRDAVAVTASHAYQNDAAVKAIGEAQSVQPSCFGVTNLNPTTTTSSTTSTTTTVVDPPSSSSTTVAPTTTVIEPPSSSSTTVAPTTTSGGGGIASTTTTTVATEVLPEVQEMPDPTPVAANPSFTG
ncbi:MAG: hypothetical protein RIB98_17340 [Acidimicrobiales bacterium]